MKVRLCSYVPQRHLTSLQVLAVLYVGGQSAQEEKRLLGTVENSLGIKVSLCGLSPLVGGAHPLLT